MSKFKNPFSTDRAEQLGDKLFEFYASHKSFNGLLRSKSLILEGGRGSGKTMYFLYHSYQSKKQEAFSKDISFLDFINNQELIGIHFRADSNFVPAFQHKGINDEEWVQLFSHYLNLNLTKRLLEVILDINAHTNESLDFELKDEVQELLNDKSITDYESFLRRIKSHEIKLLSFINNPGELSKPRLIINGLLLNYLAQSVLSQDLLKAKKIHVFVDEYENLLPYQQKIINTLIKHPNPVIFNIGMRKEGLKTYETLSESEIISSPHDYKRFDLEELSDSEYEELLIEICNKRLSRIPCLKNGKEELLDIRYYLGGYDYQEEIEEIVKGKGKETLKIRLKNRLSIEDTKLAILYNVENPLILRLNQVLLDRGKKPTELAEELEKFQNNKPSKYNDWIHNNKLGIVFLVAKEFKKEKKYSGFNTFKSVSSGISRYFIELCEEAFKNAWRNGFSFDEPRKLTDLEQSHAAYSITKYKINEIETYTPHSIRLKRFTILLGKIFQALHRDSKLSEPEKNHFTTQYDKLSEDTRDFLKNAILYSVLQRREQTKDKDPSIDSNNWEYHLNHIYAPYFKISARRIRSLNIDANNLESLIHGDVAKANLVANSYVKNITKDDTNQLTFEL
ncbi:ORC-CDC6 family AAA ATPase [Winogradskyella poriferorum]|uniref:ATP-binding protein n=1 Tax=Winogradskyella poriferorum TaxID=307627 RepID=A0ABU7W4T0_9FLAO